MGVMVTPLEGRNASLRFYSLVRKMVPDTTSRCWIVGLFQTAVTLSTCPLVKVYPFSIQHTATVSVIRLFGTFPKNDNQARGKAATPWTQRSTDVRIKHLMRRWEGKGDRRNKWIGFAVAGASTLAQYSCRRRCLCRHHHI